MRWLRRTALLILLLVVLLAVAAGFYASRALPKTDGVERMPGLRAEVRIERDEHGVPTLRAASADDAAFALGYVHAQDRLWQMETHRRIGAGRLSEAFGPQTVDTDRFLRALGVRRAAEAQWAAASPASKALLTAYSAGVNAWLRQGMKARPPEFLILGTDPEAWTPVDTLSWAIMMAWDLGANWGNELMRMRLSLKLPVSRIDELMPPTGGAPPMPVADYAALYRALGVDGTMGQRAEAAAPVSGIEGVGSNNWVVSGARSATGHPLVANDPHLSLSAPSLWYFVRIDAPGWKVAGATIPALPAVILGQNEHIAWGFTDTAPDVQDLYLERIKPDDDTQYQTPEGWAAFQRFDSVIKVRGGADVPFTARATRHGPVIVVADGLTGPAAKPSFAIAMRWTALDADGASVDATSAMQRARSVDEFIAATAAYVAPMQNMVVGDREGHIGEVSAGRVPLRKPENDLHGLVPAPGWDARYDWAGFLDPTQTPRERDPARGYIATANQRIVTDDYPHYIGESWSAPWRFRRIGSLIEATPKHDLASFRAIQADTRSEATMQLLPWLLKAQASHPLAAAARQSLQGFDGSMKPDAAAPAIYWAWYRQLVSGVFVDEVGQTQFDRLVNGRGLRGALVAALRRDDAWWCDDKSTPVAETCQQQVDAAFARALDELQAAQGADVGRWRWGRAHVARAEHRPFSSVPALAGMFELRAPVGGDTFSVNANRVKLLADEHTGERYHADQAPSMRGLYDVADPTRSRVVLPGGQSGFFFSPRYRDLLQRWVDVDSIPLWSAPAVATLVLQPG